MDLQKSILFLASTHHELPFAPSRIPKEMHHSTRPFVLSNVKNDLPVSAYLIGMGKARAHERLNQLQSWLVQNKVKPLLFHFGFSGATMSKWPVGTVFMPHFFEEVLTRYPFLKKATAGLPLLKTMQVDKVVNTVQERNAILNSSGAAAIDMESFLCAEWAARREFPLIGIRCLFDLPKHDFGNFQLLMNANGDLNWVHLIREYALNPKKLLNMSQTARLCKKQLSSTAVRVLDELKNAIG